MPIVLGPNQYGKAENRIVRIYRDSARHEIRDVSVTTSLRGNFADAHTRGDQAQVLPTDSQKNTCFAFAKQKGIGDIESFALDLARHFVDDVRPVTGARIAVEDYAWERIVVGDTEHDHAFVRKGQEVRTTLVTVEGEGENQQVTVSSGLKDLVLLKSTGSQFRGFLRDEYTTLEETDDRVMATSLAARWRYIGTDVDWDDSYSRIRQVLLEQFASVHSHALQQTLWEMGRAVLQAHPDVAEISFSAPNRHHFVVDLSAFGEDNPGEVLFAADRPYGLIECTVTRDDAPPAPRAWGSFA